MQLVNEEQLKQNLAKNLRYLRLSRTPPLSQIMLAKKLGVTQQSIYRYEKAITLPPLAVFMDMTAYFNYTAEELLSDTLPAKKGMNTNE